MEYLEHLKQTTATYNTGEPHKYNADQKQTENGMYDFIYNSKPKSNGYPRGKIMTVRELKISQVPHLFWVLVMFMRQKKFQLYIYDLPTLQKNVFIKYTLRKKTQVENFQFNIRLLTIWLQSSFQPLFSSLFVAALHSPNICPLSTCFVLSDIPFATWRLISTFCSLLRSLLREAFKTPCTIFWTPTIICASLQLSRIYHMLMRLLHQTVNSI